MSLFCVAHTLVQQTYGKMTILSKKALVHFHDYMIAGQGGAGANPSFQPP